jgi:Tol biopolymer transport system component
VAFVSETGRGTGSISLRALDSAETRTLDGTKGARGIFWSPDGRTIAFFADGKLKRLAAAGGAPQTIGDGNGTGGGAWAPDGTIVFSPEFGESLYRIPASGGTPALVTKLDPGRQEVFHAWPRFLPDGRRFLYVARSVTRDKTAIRVGSLDSTDSPVVVRADSSGVYVPPGQLLFGREGALLAQKFDAKSCKVEGEAVPLVPRMRIDFADNNALLSSSSDGSVVAYVAGDPPQEQLTWLDREGKALGTVGSPDNYGELSVSPDGKRAVTAIGDRDKGTTDVWVVDLARGTKTRLTSDPTDDFSALWSPDGERVLFTSDREGFYNLYAVAASGAGATETVLKTRLDKWSTDWSADGATVLYNQFEPKTKFDIWMLPLSAGGKPVEFLRTPYSEGGARLSRDGRWIAYGSDETGRAEAFVQSFPPSGFKRQVSTAGGTLPRFNASGTELFYVSADRKLMAVPLRTLGSELETGDPKPLFELRREAFEVAADGRFLAVVPVEAESAPVTVVLNWGLGRGR